MPNLQTRKNSQNVWIQKVKTLTGRIQKLHAEIETVADSYEALRDDAVNDDMKEAVDIAFSGLYEARAALCAKKALGGSKTQRGSRSKTRRSGSGCRV
jgi:hypothetical protein